MHLVCHCLLASSAYESIRKHVSLRNMRLLKNPAILLSLFTLSGIVSFAMSVSLSSRPVTVIRDSLQVDGRPRDYRLVVPPTSAGERLPVIFHFHGHGNTPESEADRTKLDHLAASHRVVLVYPAAIEGNWRTRAIDSVAPDENLDVRFFDALLKRLVERFGIDRSRVYVTGMSMGSEFAHELAMARSQKIAAVVACSACPSEKLWSDRPLPIMMVVGEQETMLLEAAKQDMIEYRRQGHVCEVLVNHDCGHEWLPDRNMQIWRFLKQHQLNE